jgi:hypothetical protein
VITISNLGFSLGPISVKIQSCVLYELCSSIHVYQQVNLDLMTCRLKKFKIKEKDQKRKEKEMHEKVQNNKRHL